MSIDPSTLTTVGFRMEATGEYRKLEVDESKATKDNGICNSLTEPRPHKWYLCGQIRAVL